MNRYQADVLRFRTALDLPVGSTKTPGFSSHEEADLSASIINEEIGETVAAVRARDMLETIDGLCDALYVAFACGISIGFDIAAVVPSLPEPNGGPDGSASSLFWRAEDFERVLLAAARLTCGAIERRDSYAVGVALVGLVATIMNTALAWGIPLRPFWAEVQRANMEKVGGPIRADGKRLKPPGWRAPDHLPIFLDVFGCVPEAPQAGRAA